MRINWYAAAVVTVMKWLCITFTQVQDQVEDSVGLLAALVLQVHLGPSLLMTSSTCYNVRLCEFLKCACLIPSYWDFQHVRLHKHNIISLSRRGCEEICVWSSRSTRTSWNAEQRQQRIQHSGSVWTCRQPHERCVKVSYFKKTKQT